MQADEKTFDVDFGELRPPTFRGLVDQANQKVVAVEVDDGGEFPKIVVTVRAT